VVFLLPADFCCTVSLVGVFYFVVVADFVDEGVGLVFLVVEDVDVEVALAMSMLVVELGGR
jgi:hypothetical protein